MAIKEVGEVFTGLVEAKGSFVARTQARFVFDWPGSQGTFQLGESIAVNGCCLTVVGFEGQSFSVEVVGETLLRTNLGSLKEGEGVNLERPMLVGDAFGGHMVLGHVDTTGTVEDVAPLLRVSYPDGFDNFVVEKGSIAIDGVSLTIAAAGENWIEAAIIPHTAEVTTLGQKRAGDKVNLEFDIIAKHVAKMISAQLGKLSR